MKHLILALLLTITTTTFSQHFELHYDAVSLVYDAGHENVIKSGVIEITKSQIKYNNKHAEDLLYLGKMDDGAFVRHSWARLEDPGNAYIVLRVLDNKPFQLSIRAYGNVVLFNDKIIRRDTVIYYIDTNRNSFTFHKN